MKKIRTIEIKQSIFEENDAAALRIKEVLKKSGTCMLNIMGSPGCGKTTLILALSKLLNTEKILVIEGDVDSTVDAEKIIEAGFDSLQINTGGFCHLDANMIEAAFEKTDIRKYDYIFIENIGNLICPASYDLGSALNAVLLSVPEGDDKPLKYPPVFKFADVVIVSKYDYLEVSDFDFEKFSGHVEFINPKSKIFSVSAKGGFGLDTLTEYILKNTDA